MAHTLTDTLGSLLRGELSAVETYEQALDKLGAEKGPANVKGSAELRRIHAQHGEAANVLQQHVLQHGGHAERSSGAWGVFAQAVEGTAGLLGTDAALQALKQGEEQGIRDYEAALQDEELLADCKDLIRSTLLPKTRDHVPALNRLIKGMVERISPRLARQHLQMDPSVLLVCAYDEPEKFEQHHLAGAISLAEFQARVNALPQTQEIIFYCA
jgi:hypothetical protein